MKQKQFRSACSQMLAIVATIAFAAVAAFVPVVGFAADELTVNASFNYTKGFDTINRTTGAVVIDVSSGVRGGGSFTVSTNNNLITIQNVTSPGMYFIRNLDTANSVSFGPATNSFLLTLEAGEFSIGRMYDTNLWGKATGGNVLCEFILLSD